MNAARAILLALLLGWVFPALADVAVPQLTGRVVDQTGTLSGDDVASLTQTLKSLEARKGSQIAVLIVPTTQPESIEQFSIRVAEAWKIGRKKIDDGALLVIAKNDRHLRIEVGYGLEGALTDVTTKRIIDEDITPKFKSGDFAGGVRAGVARMIQVIDGEPLPAPEPPHWQSPGFSIGPGDIFNPFLIIPVLLFGGMISEIAGPAARLGCDRRFGRVDCVGPGRLATRGDPHGCGRVDLCHVQRCRHLADAKRSQRRGGWSSGSSGGSWSSGSSSSSDSGSFGGGGGSFGGGGASGSW